MGRAFEFRKARKMKRWSAMAKAFTRIGKDLLLLLRKVVQIQITTLDYEQLYKMLNQLICLKRI